MEHKAAQQIQFQSNIRHKNFLGDVISIKKHKKQSVWV